MEWKGEGWKVGTKVQSLLEAIRRVSGSLSGGEREPPGWSVWGGEGWKVGLRLSLSRITKPELRLSHPPPPSYPPPSTPCR